MTRAGLVALVVLIGVSPPPPLMAQVLPREAVPQPGERVRLSRLADGLPLVVSGTFMGAEGDSLLLQVAAATDLKFALADVIRLEASGGRSHGAGALRGILFGGLGGAGLGLLLGALDPGGCSGCDSAGASMVIAAFSLGTLGLVAGGAIGAAVGVERWEVRWAAEGTR